MSTAIAVSLLTLMCHSLQERTLAPHQSFQLPLEGSPAWWSEVFAEALRDPPFAYRVRGQWLWVDNNRCDSHRCVMKVFGCVY